MGLKTITVPRNADDRKSVENWQRAADSISQIHSIVEEYSVDVPLLNAETGSFFNSVTFNLTAGANADVKVYTVPAAAAGKKQTFVLCRNTVWCLQRLGGSDTGSVKVRVGTSAGANDIMTDQTIVAATLLTIIGGLSIASRGSGMLAANGYEMPLDPGTEVWMRAATTGTITQGKAICSLHGHFEP